MRVVLLPSFYPVETRPLSGSFFREQARALRDAGLDVGVVFCAEKAPWQEPRRPGSWPSGIVRFDDHGVPTTVRYRTRWIPGYGRFRIGLRVRAWLRAFRVHVKRHGVPDLVHVHSADPAGLVGAAVKRTWKLPMVLTEHASWLASGTTGGARDRIAAIGYRDADAGIAVSPALAAALAARLPVPVGGWRDVPNLVDAAFLEAPLGSKTEDERGRFVFLTVGWLVPVKGHDVLLDAFARTFRGSRDVLLRIAGSGRLGSDLRARAARLGISEQVEFLGAIGRDEVVEQLRRADAFVLPSRLETFGIAAVEALAMGRPVVATRCGGPESVVGESEGLLVDVGEVDGLGAGLERMRREAGRFDAEALRASAAARFGPRTVTGKIVEVYREVLRSHSVADREA